MRASALGQKQPLKYEQILSFECPVLAESSRSKSSISINLSVRSWEKQTLSSIHLNNFHIAQN